MRIDWHTYAVREVLAHVKLRRYLDLEPQSQGELQHFCSTMVADPSYHQVIFNYRREVR